MMGAEMPGVTLEQARAAKVALLRHCEKLGIDVAAGVTRVEGDYAVKVNLKERVPDGVTIPSEINGVPIRVEVVGTIRKR
jgi:hypothetical protein